MMTRDRIDGWLIALFAICTAIMFESMRVFVSYLVFVVDQSERTTIAVAAIAVFAFPALAGLAITTLGIPRILSGSIWILLLARLTIQFVDDPVLRIIAGGVVIVAWGILAVTIFAMRRQSAAIGFLFGLGLDLALRAAIGPLDLPWIPDLTRTIITLALILLSIALWIPTRKAFTGFNAGASWRSAAPLIAIGPAIALFHVVTGNIAFVTTHTGLSTAAASGLLAAGFILGVGIAALRLLAVGAAGAGGTLILRFVFFDAVIGGVSLSLAWSGEGLAALGVLFATVTATELIILATISEGEAGSATATPTAIIFTIGMLLQFIALFLYYTATGSGIILGGIWIVLVAGAFAAIGLIPAAMAHRPLRLDARVVPAAAVIVLLAVAPLIALAETSPLSTGSSDGTITVMSYNIQSGFSKDNHWDLEATAGVIAESGSDIVVLQEVSRGWLVTTGNEQLRWLSDRLDLAYAWGGASRDDLWGNAVLSRYPIVSSNVVKYDTSQNLRRSALVVTLDIGQDTLIQVIATHLDNPAGAGTARSEQVDQLVEIIDLNRPTIVAGDFNMTPDDPLVGSILATGLLDAGLVAGAVDATSEDGRRIDYIFVSNDFGIVEGEVIDSDASDHRPIVVTLLVP